MVARMWRGLTPASKATKYMQYMTDTGVKDCLATKGNRGVLVLQRVTPEDSAEFLFFSFWESLDSIRSFAGDNIEKAVYYPEDKGYLLALEPGVVHYEVSEFGRRDSQSK
jgi:heme-degrading monooxygenase HmoA